jgi:hypothetical protein
MRVITTVTAAVAAKPSQVSSCFAVLPAGAPEASCVTLVMSDPEVHVHRRPRDHADERADRVVAERHAGEPVGVVQEVERKGGRQPREQHDLESLAADCPIDRGELRIAGNPGRDAVASERPPEQEGGRGAEIRGHPHQRDADGNAVGESRAERQDETRQQEDAGDDVREYEDRHARRAGVADPGHEREQPLIDREELHGGHHGDRDQRERDEARAAGSRRRSLARADARVLGVRTHRSLLDAGFAARAGRLRVSTRFSAARARRATDICRAAV